MLVRGEDSWGRRGFDAIVGEMRLYIHIVEEKGAGMSVIVDVHGLIKMWVEGRL